MENLLALLSYKRKQILTKNLTETRNLGKEGLALPRGLALQGVLSLFDLISRRGLDNARRVHSVLEFSDVNRWEFFKIEWKFEDGKWLSMGDQYRYLKNEIRYDENVAIESAISVISELFNL